MWYVYIIYYTCYIHIYYGNHLYPLLIFAEVRNCSSGCTFMRMDCCPKKKCAMDSDGPKSTASRISDRQKNHLYPKGYRVFVNQYGNMWQQFSEIASALYPRCPFLSWSNSKAADVLGQTWGLIGQWGLGWCKNVSLQYMVNLLIPSKKRIF